MNPPWLHVKPHLNAKKPSRDREEALPRPLELAAPLGSLPSSRGSAPLPKCHSYRKATIGSTLAARRAGM
jgi:hypothetical protein